MNIDEILAKGKENWTIEESVFVDYMYALYQENGAQIKPNQMLPSGRFLHNPAQKTLPSGADMAAKLIKNATQNAADWVKGMETPSRDPIKAALDAKEKYYNNLALAKEKGLWEKNLAKSSHAEIVAVVKALGSGVISNGINARKPKIIAAFNELQPKLQAVSNAIQALPNDTQAANTQRMVQNLELMRKIKEGP